MATLQRMTQRSESRLLTWILVGATMWMVGGAVAALVLVEPLVVVVALAVGAALSAYTTWALRFFEVTVSEAGIHYRWAGARGRTIAPGEIERVEVVRYPWYYGYGWRFFGRNVAYSMPFAREALAVTKKSGAFRRYLFALPACEEARAALEEVQRAG